MADNERRIWDFLIENIGNPCGVAGVMGNLYAESALNPKNLQGSFEKKFGMTDDEYTAQTDDGRYANFVRDGAGYGLAQWTYWSRKQGLYDVAKERGVSVGDLDTQLDWMWTELQAYSGVLKVLKSASTVKEASDKFAQSYERPADQSQAALNKRAQYGLKYYEKYATPKYAEVNETMSVIIGSARIDENGNAYNGKAGDQTGKEVSTQTWYKHSKGWRVFRAKDPTKAKKIAYAMQAACDNPHIGYDQYQRLTLYNEAKLVGFDPGKVTKDVETDCSALVRVCCAYAGIELRNFTTDNEPTVLNQSGEFTEMVGAKYTDTSDYLMAGDILDTAVKGHTVVVLSDGARARDDDGTLRKGDKGEAVVEMQKALMKAGYELQKYGADGDFGGETLTALKKFQGDHGLATTGVYDLATRYALLGTMKEAAPANPMESYTVILRNVSKADMETLTQHWPEHEIIKE